MVVTDQQPLQQLVVRWMNLWNCIVYIADDKFHQEKYLRHIHPLSTILRRIYWCTMDLTHHGSGVFRRETGRMRGTIFLSSLFVQHSMSQNEQLVERNYSSSIFIHKISYQFTVHGINVKETNALVF